MEINDFIGVYEKSVEKEVCDQLIQGFNDHKHLPGFREGSMTQKSSLRKDESVFFDSITIMNMMGGTPYLVPTINTFNDRLQTCFSDYIENYALLDKTTEGVASYVIKVHHVKPHEGYHTFHSEVGSLDSLNRYLVWLCYLNDVEEGGETEFLYQGVKVKPETGKMLIWPAQWTHTHRGNPIYKGEKYYATGWFNYIK
tara:strand:- start:1228 stop:1821 length:594 start_codon:yes stop_codon:yes gene_type:complete